jgi:hypothetical protein
MRGLLRVVTTMGASKGRRYAVKPEGDIVALFIEHAEQPAHGSSRHGELEQPVFEDLVDRVRPVIGTTIR